MYQIEFQVDFRVVIDVHISEEEMGLSFFLCQLSMNGST